MSELTKKSLLAGILIGIGVIINSLTTVPIMGAVFFSFGLLTICHYQLFLYTGKIGNFKDYGFSLIPIFLFNWIGCAGTVFCFSIANPAIFPILASAAKTKFTKDICQFFIMSLFCGGLVHIAVKSKNQLITLMAISIFILIGAEHCIALIPYLCFATTPIAFVDFLVVILGNSLGAIGVNYLMKEKKDE